MEEIRRKVNEHCDDEHIDESIEQFLHEVEHLPVFGLVRSRDMSTEEIINQKICRYIRIPNDGKQMYEIKIKDKLGNVRVVKITGNHSVFTKKGKVKAQNLKVGQKVFLDK